MNATRLPAISAAIMRDIEGGVDMSAAPEISSVGSFSSLSRACVISFLERLTEFAPDHRLVLETPSRPSRPPDWRRDRRVRARGTRPASRPSPSADEGRSLGDFAVTHAKRVARYGEAQQPRLIGEREVGRDAAARRRGHQVEAAKAEMIHERAQVFRANAGIVCGRTAPS